MEFTLEFARIFFIEQSHAAPVVLFLLLWIAGLGLVIGRTKGWPRWGSTPSTTHSARSTSPADGPRSRRGYGASLGISQ